jgi:hypothetical protein
VPEDINEGNTENQYGYGFRRDIKRYVPLSARHYPVPLTAHGLHDFLREKRFDYAEVPDVHRRLIHIADPHAAYVQALSCTVGCAQVDELRDAIASHLGRDSTNGTILAWHEDLQVSTTREAENMIWIMETDNSDDEGSHWASRGGWIERHLPFFTIRRTNHSGSTISHTGCYSHLMRRVQARPEDVRWARHRNLAHSILLTAAQIVFTLPLQTYDLCHGKVPQDTHDALIPSGSCAYLQDYLPPYLELVEHNSTTFFVFSALAYGAVAMREYHINRQDRHQGIFLMVGLVAGFLACWDARQIVSSRIAFCISIALLTSACGHWVYAMCFGSRTEGQGAVKVEKEDGADAV